jgi:hypothetical protein
MLRWAGVVVAAAAALLSPPPLAAADPVAPQPGTPCPSNLVEAMTWPPDDKTPLVCVGQPTGLWQPVDTPYPISDRWFSYGPAMTLHGQGRPNPTLMSGNWTATPLIPEGRCRAEQLAVIPGSPTVGPPQVSEGERGQPLSLQVVPTLFSIEMSGECLWQKTDADQPEPGPQPRSGW